MDETLVEKDDPKQSRRVHVLSYVLHYDDLLADNAAVFVVDGARRITIGRGEGATQHSYTDKRELRIADPWASKSHAVVELLAGSAQLIDSQSRNGTYLNGQRVAEQTLCDGDLFEVGHSLLCYRYAEASSVERLVAKPKSFAIGPTRTQCPEVAELVHNLQKVAPTPEPILVLGETGAGKEMVAQTIHDLSGRNGEFRAVDCGAVPDSLFESTFFGHRRGAFTGAQEPRVGEIVRARNGTLFLDEVGNMSLTCQAKLLRVIETGKVTPLGASEAETVDVRFVAATNRDLTDEQTFRPDLLRRLAGFVVKLVPLRGRREDLGFLTQFLLSDAGVHNASIQSIAARKLFCSAFTGNIRQLRASLRSASVLAAGDCIGLPHLPADLEPITERDECDGDSAPLEAEPRKKNPSKADVEAALTKAGGNVVHAAKTLSTHPRQVYRWMQRLGIDLDRFRQT